MENNGGLPYSSEDLRIFISILNSLNNNDTPPPNANANHQTLRIPAENEANRRGELQSQDAPRLCMPSLRPISCCKHHDWDLSEIARIQEINESRQRAESMETSESWREKWNLVRNERNRMREESNRLRTLLSKTKTEAYDLGNRLEMSRAEVRDLQKKLQNVSTAPGNPSDASFEHDSKVRRKSI